MFFGYLDIHYYNYCKMCYLWKCIIPKQKKELKYRFLDFIVLVKTCYDLYLIKCSGHAEIIIACVKKYNSMKLLNVPNTFRY